MPQATARIAPGVKLTPERDGFVVDGQRVQGFPHITTLLPDQQLRVARWALQRTPDAVSPEQIELLERDRRPPTARQQQALVQERYLAAPLVRALWRRLPEEHRQRVLTPESHTGGAYYPLRTAELAHLAGLTPRQVRYWSDRRLLRHAVNSHGHRLFELPAAIVALSLAGSPQNARQFYADVGHASLADMRTVLSLVGVSLLEGAAGVDSASELLEVETLLADLHTAVREQRLAAVA